MTNKEIAQKVVDRMVEEINKGGSLPWVKPWDNGGNRPRPVMVVDGWTEITITPQFWNRAGKPYSGVNIWLLGASGHRGEFITFTQCKKEGGSVKKGAKASTVVYWNMIRKETDELDENGNKKVKTIPILKYYNVFSVEDCEGLKKKPAPAPRVVRYPKVHYEYPEPKEGEPVPEFNDAAEAIIAGYVQRADPLKLYREDYSDEAYYSPAQDKVVVPNAKQYTEIAEYYSTLFHELGHSTGHATRLNRFAEAKGSAAFGSESYSREELVAEMTSAIILNTIGMETGNTFRNSAAYVQSWSEHIKNDPMMFVTAASRAEKAVEMILTGNSTEEVNVDD